MPWKGSYFYLKNSMIALLCLMLALLARPQVLGYLGSVVGVFFIFASIFPQREALFLFPDTLSCLLLSITLFLLPLILNASRAPSTQLLATFSIITMVLILLLMTQRTMLFYIRFEAVSLPVLAGGAQP